MKFENFKNASIGNVQLNELVGGTDIFGEDTGFVIEDDIMVVNGIVEELGDI